MEPSSVCRSEKSWEGDADPTASSPSKEGKVRITDRVH